MEASNFLPVLSRILLPFITAVVLGLSPVPEKVQRAYQQVHAALQDENLAQAASGLVQIVEIQHWRDTLLERAGFLYVRSGDISEAVMVLEEAAQRGDLSSQGYLVLADGYERLGRLADALDIWLVQVDSSVLNADLFARIVAAAETMGDEERLLSIFEAWIEQHPEQAEPNYRLGLLLLFNDPSTGMMYLEQAAQLEPVYQGKVETIASALNLSDSEAPASYQMVLIGQTLGKVSEWGLAKRAFLKAIEIDPDYAEAWAYLGEALQQLDEPALDAIEKANALSPDSILVKAISSLYWRRQNQPDKAIDILVEIRNANPDEGKWLAELANVYAQQGDLVNAVAFYSDAIQNDPENPLFWKNLVVFCLQYQYEIRNTALPSARQVVILEHESSSSLVLMGQVMMSLEDYLSARRFFEWALEKDNSNAVAYYYHGQLLLIEGNLPVAHQYLSMAILYDKGLSEVTHAARQLIDKYFPDTP